MSETIDRRAFIEGGAALMLTACLGDALGQEIPRSRFGAGATAEQVTAGIDLAGKTMVVTGCNSGIGLETMRVLALRGAQLIGTARTLERGRDACAGVDGKATPVVLELSDFDSVVECAEQIRKLDVPLDALVCNAGVLLTDWQTVRGLERQFVVNHLGHFLLANRLLDRVTAAPQGRVVVVGSTAHRFAPPGGIQFDDLSGKAWYRAAYAHSKLANGLFSLELAKRLGGSRATSNSLHPGVVATNIFRNMAPAGGGGGSSPFGNSLETPAQGAATSCYLAADPALAETSGLYFADCNPAESSEYQRDHAMAARLWDVSAELLRKYL